MLLLLLILPIAALVRRRVPMTMLLTMVAAWIAIFGVGLLVLHRLS